MPPTATPRRHMPRMLWCVIISVLLLVVTVQVQSTAPQGLLAVTLYKAHLMALGGWGGYWIDRALFPYDRPHEYLQPDPPAALASIGGEQAFDQLQALESELQVCSDGAFGLSMVRRALVVAACLLCVGLGA